MGLNICTGIIKQFNLRDQRSDPELNKDAETMSGSVCENDCMDLLIRDHVFVCLCVCVCVLAVSTQLIPSLILLDPSAKY